MDFAAGPGAADQHALDPTEVRVNLVQALRSRGQPAIQRAPNVFPREGGRRRRRKLPAVTGASVGQLRERAHEPSQDDVVERVQAEPRRLVDEHLLRHALLGGDGLRHERGEEQGLIGVGVELDALLEPRRQRRAWTPPLVEQGGALVTAVEHGYREALGRSRRASGLRETSDYRAAPIPVLVHRRPEGDVHVHRRSVEPRRQRRLRLGITAPERQRERGPDDPASPHALTLRPPSTPEVSCRDPEVIEPIGH